jgi:hypothetical protein
MGDLFGYKARIPTDSEQALVIASGCGIIQGV